MIIDGKALAKNIISSLGALKKDFSGKKVVGILVGDSPDSLSFLRQKKNTAEMLGIDFEIEKVGAPIAPELLYEKVREISSGPMVVGVIVQLKIPGYSAEDTQMILDAIPSEKDIDCLGRMRSDIFYKDPLNSEIVPPAVGAVKSIIGKICDCDSGEEIYHFLRGKKVVIYGFGRLVGQPSEAWLRAVGSDVVVIRSKSSENERVNALKAADIVITGVGKTGLVTGEMIKSGVIVIDFGYPAAADAISIDAKGGLVTPTPRGTGPVLVAELFRNLYRLNS